MKSKKNTPRLNNDEGNNDYDLLKWKFAVENSKIGVWDWNAVTNNVFYSKESKSILGYEDNEVNPTSEAWDAYVYEEDKAQYFKDFQDHINGVNTYYRNEHRVKCKDGNYKWILDRGKIIERSTNGEPTRIIGTHTDITERKERETKLISNLDIITSQNQKLLNFAHIVSHNLRTHTGNLNHMIKFYEESATHREKLENFNYIKTVAKSLLDTVNDLEDVVKVQVTENSLETQRLNLLDYINKALNVLKTDVSDFGTSVFINVDESIFINFLPAYLESVLLNIFTNAIKFRRNHVPLKIDISIEELNDSYILRISDNGIGIDLEKYGEKLFGMYNTFHNKTEYDSRGIGLYITKNQLEAFNGEISVESEIDKGSTFIVTLKK